MTGVSLLESDIFFRPQLPASSVSLSLAVEEFPNYHLELR